MKDNYIKVLTALLNIGRKAAKKVLELYNNQDFSVETKDDNSPVTTADIASNNIIVKALKRKFPNYAILSEETFDDIRRLDNDYVFIIDPIDGTKDFIGGDGEFSINLALAYKNEVVVGVVFVPALDLVYYAAKGYGAYKMNFTTKAWSPIHVSDKVRNLTVLTSRYHLTDGERNLIEKHKAVISTSKTVGSSYKMCYIAEGNAEITYRLNPGTKEWDTAAPQIIVLEAGGLFLSLKDHQPLRYNRVDVRNLDGYIITNRKENILL